VAPGPVHQFSTRELMHLLSAYLLSDSRRSLLLTLVLGGVLLPGLAQGQFAPPPGGVDSDAVQVGLSYFGVGERERVLSLDLGYRPGLTLPWGVRLQVGGVVTTEGSAYGYGGLVRPLPIVSGLVVTPTLGAGAYHRGHGVDLGSVLEFRSGISLGWEVARGQRISVHLYHLSNAGLGNRNPGVEALGITWSMSLRGS
jgi:lipid A 3-O-deacylase